MNEANQSTEQRTCVSCQAEFAIAPEDFAFYQKIDVPPPTWCPDCRAQRRMAWRNEWHIFRRPDAKTGKSVFSVYTPSSPVKIYEPDEWYGDSWDPMEYGRDYDFSRPFFKQIYDLMLEVPTLSRPVKHLENSDYSANATYLKNCYLVRAGNHTEDSGYIVRTHGSRDCYDCYLIDSSELCYDSFNLTNCHRTFYSSNCENCSEVMFSKDCAGSSNLFGCVGLRNKQFHIWNQPYSKEEYEAKLRHYQLGSHRQVEELRSQAREFWCKFPNKFMRGTSNEHVSGEYILGSKNAQHCYMVRDCEDSKFCQYIVSGPVRECYDYTIFGTNGAELLYECLGCAEQAYNLKCCWYSWVSNRNLTYAMFCQNSSDLFGCVGLRKKQFCILNKQYTEEEYNQLVPKIIEHMNEMPYTDTQGRIYRYGEFFPIEHSPIDYNVSLAQEHFPMSKEEALAAGYRWHESATRDLTIDIRPDELPDDIREATEDLIGKVIGCQHTGQCQEECSIGFTLIPQELAFLIKQGLPLPRLCPNCRHHSRIKQRQPLQLHQRTCDCQGQQSSNGVYANVSSEHPDHGPNDACPNKFETSYLPADATHQALQAGAAPDRPEIVYCEPCYQAEVV